MRCGHALALRAGALGSRGLAPPPRRPPEQAQCAPFRVPCMRRERAPPPPARLLPEVTPSPQSVVPARVARSRRRGERGAVRPRRPASFLHASVEAPPASAAIPVRVSERRGCGQSGADRLGPVPRAGAGPRKQEAAAARSGGDKGVVERGKEGLGLARLGPAQRVGVLAAGGRMVQKEGQTALEEPQGSPNPAGVPGAPLEPPGAAAGPVPGGEETDTETETALGSRRFLCGVVEGFYGRPWVMEQRKELFRRLQKWGLNTYLYAPKDDYKHRMFWREMYSVEEAEQLMTLISAAREHEIEFIYAISPGLDITFSNPKEVSTLKRKLDQVSQFGCRSFALLFDDIDHNMCAADKEVFSSFAHAQVSITNEIYQYLGEPDTFLFCPTEYCGTFCYPNVAQSPYLRTVGEKLLPGIEVLWTGPKVVSKDIPVESIEEVSKIIRRAPVIWDNIHANDYDQKRLFLGPYKGRSTELIPRLKGVLTNPNCEFEANYVAIHTLATWYKSNMNGVRKDVVMTDTEDSTVSIQIKLENEGSDEDIETDVLYSPQMALKLALTEWLQEFGVPQQYSSRQVAHSGAKTTVGDVGPLVAPSSLNAATVVTTVYQEPIMSQGAALSSESPALVKEEEKKQSDEEPMDMVVEKQDDADKNANQILTDIAEAKMAEELKPMDTDKESIAESKSPEMSMQEDSGSDIAPMQTDEQINKEQFVPGPNEKPLYTVEPVTLEDLQLLADLFYLPYEHGPKGAQMLREFQWLRANSSVVSVNCKGKDAEKR
uniref:protein O-GlcNAcase n=1 Tax=Accipiter nisus TaxID=211598 RepID=A0A8B9MB82_9AVES